MRRITTAGTSFKVTYGKNGPRYYMRTADGGRWQRITEALYEEADMLASLVHADWWNEYPASGVEIIGFTLPCTITVDDGDDTASPESPAAPETWEEAEAAHIF